jgi:hypothetical protein
MTQMLLRIRHKSNHCSCQWRYNCSAAVKVSTGQRSNAICKWLANQALEKIPPQLIRSMRCRVRRSRAQLTVQQLQGITINNSFGYLWALTETKWFVTLVAQHNDPNDGNHLDMFEAVIIGRNLQAERDIVLLNTTSEWFLCNVLRAIECWWIFQLNGHATFNFCSRVVDIISLGVNYLCAHNHTLAGLSFRNQLRANWAILEA